MRQALLRRPHSGACVMVGSGFSKNYDGCETNARVVPGWLELAKLLHHELYSVGSPRNPPRPTSSEQCMDLASQYEAFRTRPALDEFLRKHVPDDLEPHALHLKLLELSWRDVFTTNWDTLLERAALQLATTDYTPVYSGADLRQAPTHRIVRLHGSLTERPVVTSDDYRTYDAHSAVLSHTVRQYLAENVFLLLGFSGDDPNFMKWHGWIRDQLAETAPGIFVGGFLELTAPQRASFEARGIHPIDLADYPNANLWGRDAHRIALQWILDVLTQEDDALTGWPEPQGPLSSNAASLSGPMPVSVSSAGHKEPSWPAQDASPEDEDVAVQELICAWRQYRESYEGWIVLPFRRIGGLSADTDHWEKIVLRRTETWAVKERLIALRELSWRYEMLMNPHKPDSAKAITETVGEFDSTLSQDRPAESEEFDCLLNCRNVLLLSMLTEARCQFEEEQFFDVSEKVAVWLIRGTDPWHRFQHEQCLWALTVQAFDELQDRLDDWSIDGDDRFWAIRKAAILADMGAYKQAFELAEGSVVELEERAGKMVDVASFSRLAWALQWSMARETRKLWEREEKGPANYQVILDRWTQLAQYECDVGSEWQRFEQAVETIRTPPPAGSLSPPPHRRDVLRMDEYTRYRHAYRAVRMIELAGLPSRIPGVRMAAGTLRKAAEAMASLGADHAFPVAVRAGSDCSPGGFGAVLSPGNLAILEQRVADRILETLERGRDYRLTQEQGSGLEGRTGAEEAAANIDALSRCMPRAGDERAKANFRWAVEYSGRYGHQAGHNVRRMARALWQESWRSTSPASRFDLLFDLLSSSTLDTLAISDFGDPADVLTEHDLPLRRGERRAAEWSSCVAGLVDALGRGDGARERAARRLRWMLDAGLLTEFEKAEMAKGLWSPQFLDDYGMPTTTTLFDFAQLSMPEPQPGMAIRAFRKKWIGAEVAEGDHGAVESVVAEVSAAWRKDLRCHRPFELLPEEEQWFWKLVERWLCADARRRSFTWGPDAQRESRVISGIAALVARREVPRRILGRLYLKVEILSKPRQWAMMPMFHGNEYRLIAAAAGQHSRRSRRAETLLRMGMLADDEKIQKSALYGLAWWIEEASAPGTRLRRPSLRCVEDMGVLVASQHEKGGTAAMEAAIAVLKGQSNRDVGVIVPLAVEGLQKWRSALAYSRPDVGGTTWDKTVVGRRRSCVRLAYALHSGGHSTQEIVKRWLDAGKEDPMAEVRYAAEGLEDFGRG